MGLSRRSDGRLGSAAAMPSARGDSPHSPFEFTNLGGERETWSRASAWLRNMKRAQASVVL